MVEPVAPIAPEPAPPVSKITLAGVGLFVLALVVLLLVIPDAQPAVLPQETDPGKMYAVSCAACHGAAGEGKGPFPKITGTLKTEPEILQLLENGKDKMPRFDATPEQRAAMARFVKGLK
ncbi:MAG: cytochrome c [Planctomycetota bacterium]